MVKFISVLLVLLACLGLVSGVLDLNEFLSNSDGGSSNVQTPSDVTPDPDSPSEPDVTPVTFNVTNWHTEDHDIRCESVTSCDMCECSYNPWDLAELEELYTESFGWGSVIAYKCGCSNGTVYLTYQHCFVDGECHDCYAKCFHYNVDLDRDYLHLLPEGHPFRSEFHDYSLGWYDYDGDGYCDLCGMFFG